MKRHLISIPTWKQTQPVIDRMSMAKRTTGMFLSLSMLACVAALPAQAIEIPLSGRAIPQPAPAPIAEPGGSTAPFDEPTLWVGVAVSPTGRVFQSHGSSETRTRYEARSECENTAGYTCQAIAVPWHWDVVALLCQAGGRKGGYVGGSGIGNPQAVAYDRAYRAGFNPGECTAIYVY
jgi:hypothetical protein